MGSDRAVVVEAAARLAVPGAVFELLGVLFRAAVVLEHVDAEQLAGFLDGVYKEFALKTTEGTNKVADELEESSGKCLTVSCQLIETWTLSESGNGGGGRKGGRKGVALTIGTSSPLQSLPTPAQ